MDLNVVELYLEDLSRGDLSMLGLSTVNISRLDFFMVGGHDQSIYCDAQAAVGCLKF